jgi:hypothetical protein
VHGDSRNKKAAGALLRQAAKSKIDQLGGDK